MGVVENLQEEATGVLSLLILGAGFLALFLPELSPVSFWVVWVVGFAVVLPLFAIAVGDHDRDGAYDPTQSTGAERIDEEQTDEEDALEELKRRYARGELDDEEFETRLERLLEAEDPAAAREYVERTRASSEHREPE